MKVEILALLQLKSAKSDMFVLMKSARNPVGMGRNYRIDKVTLPVQAPFVFEKKSDITV